MIGIWVAVMSYLIINNTVNSIQHRKTAKLNDKYVKEKIVFDDISNAGSISDIGKDRQMPVETRYTVDSNKLTATVEYHGCKISRPDNKISVQQEEQFTVRDHDNNFIGYITSVQGPGSYHNVSGRFEVKDPVVLQYFYNCINTGFYQNRIMFSVSNTRCELTGCLVTAINQDDTDKKMIVTITANKMNMKQQDVHELWDAEIAGAWNKAHTCNVPTRTSLSNAYCNLYNSQMFLLKE